MSHKQYLLLFIFIITLVFNAILFLASVAQASSDLILAWSANTLVPYFYQGKSLASQGSTIAVNAVLLNRNLNPSSLDFRWSLDDTVLLNKSGKGKNSFVFTTSETAGHNYKISVVVRNSTGSYQTSASVEFKISNPKTAIYKSHMPNFNNFYQAVPDIVAKANEEFNFIAWPLFFKASDQNQLQYKWTFGNQGTSQSDIYNPNLLNLKIGPITESAIKKLMLVISDTTNKYLYARYQNNITLKP